MKNYRLLEKSLILANIREKKSTIKCHNTTSMLTCDYYLNTIIVPNMFYI